MKDSRNGPIRGCCEGNSVGLYELCKCEELFPSADERLDSGQLNCVNMTKVWFPGVGEV